jgi:FMN phosphatase YigB (HAD superfamily)
MTTKHIPKQQLSTILFDIGHVCLEIQETSTGEIQLNENKKVIWLLENLKKKYRIIAVTDASIQQVSDEIERFQFYKNFDAIEISEQCGLAKTTPRLYELILKKHHLLADEAVFIDDRIENIEAAVKASIHSIHYTSFKKLLKELAMLKITYQDDADLSL